MSENVRSDPERNARDVGRQSVALLSSVEWTWCSVQIFKYAGRILEDDLIDESNRRQGCIHKYKWAQPFNIGDGWKGEEGNSNQVSE